MNRRETRLEEKTQETGPEHRKKNDSISASRTHKPAPGKGARTATDTPSNTKKSAGTKGKEGTDRRTGKRRTASNDNREGGDGRRTRSMMMTTTTATTAGQPRLRALSPRASQIEETPAKRTRELKLTNNKKKKKRSGGNHWKRTGLQCCFRRIDRARAGQLFGSPNAFASDMSECQRWAELTHRQGHRTLLPRSFREERTKG